MGQGRETVTPNANGAAAAGGGGAGGGTESASLAAKVSQEKIDVHRNIRMQTTVKKTTLDPVWNEILRFDVGSIITDLENDPRLRTKKKGKTEMSPFYCEVRGRYRFETVESAVIVKSQ